MADVKTLSINGNLFNFKDGDARQLIENIFANKMDTFTVSEPISINNNTLSIDLSNFVTKSDLNTDKTNLTDLILRNEETNKNKIDKIYNLFEHIFSDYINVDSEDLLNFSADIPSLKNYTYDINNLQEQINSSSLKEERDINNLQEQINTNLETTNSNYDKFINELNNIKTRNTNLENEFYGSITENDGKSRLDIMEEKVNKIYEAMLRIGIIKE